MSLGVAPSKMVRGEALAIAASSGEASSRTELFAMVRAVVVFPAALGPWMTTAPNVVKERLS